MKPSEALKLRPGDRVVVYGHALREVVAVHKTGPRSVEVDTRQIQSDSKSFAAHRSEYVRLPTEADVRRYEKERALQAADVFLHSRVGWAWDTHSANDTDCASREEAKAEAEKSLGVAPAPAIPLRWVVNACGAWMTLGKVRLATAHKMIGTDFWRGDSAVAQVPKVSHATIDEAMRAVEAALGITAPLPVEVTP